jgi:hypothetical protein
MTRPGRPSSHEENKEVLFWMNCFSKDVWNVGNMLGELGKCRLYEEVSGNATITKKDSFQQGKHFVTLYWFPTLYSWQQCKVASIMWSPMRYGPL